MVASAAENVARRLLERGRDAQGALRVAADDAAVAPLLALERARAHALARVWLAQRKHEVRNSEKKKEEKNGKKKYGAAIF